MEIPGKNSAYTSTYLKIGKLPINWLKVHRVLSLHIYTIILDNKLSVTVKLKKTYMCVDSYQNNNKNIFHLKACHLRGFNN